MPLKKVPSGFTKSARIETQEAAKYNFQKRVREQEEREKLKQRIEERIQEETAPRRVEPSAKKKGK